MGAVKRYPDMSGVFQGVGMVSRKFEMNTLPIAVPGEADVIFHFPSAPKWCRFPRTIHVTFGEYPMRSSAAKHDGQAHLLLRSALAVLTVLALASFSWAAPVDPDTAALMVRG